MEPVTMGTSFTAVVSAVFTTIGDVVTTITDKPILLIPIGVAFAGAGIGLAKSLMGIRRKKGGN